MTQANSNHDLEFLSKSKYPQKAYINLQKTKAQHLPGWTTILIDKNFPKAKAYLKKKKNSDSDSDMGDTSSYSDGINY